jgi:hypothetical protein
MFVAGMMWGAILMWWWMDRDRPNAATPPQEPRASPRKVQAPPRSE